MGNRCAVLLFFSFLAIAWPNPPDLNGTWKLDLAKSHWGKKPKPASGELKINAQGEEVSVSGNVTQGGEESGQFHYAGSLDGKPHPAGYGTVTLKRVDPYTIESVWKSKDGRYVETGRTTLSKDGKQLTRVVNLKRPDGELKWTEIWDRQ